MMNRIVVIGGVACGPKAAARARHRDGEAEITIIEQGPHVSYAGCGLPYFLGGSVESAAELWTTQFGVERDPDYFESIKAIDVRLRTKAVAVDRESRTVHLQSVESGKEDSLPYDRLVLATGSRPVRPTIDGLDCDRVFNLHAPDDAVRMRTLIDADEIERALIVGGGSIALETVESLFAHGIDVTIVEREDRLLPTLLDPALAAVVEKEIRSNGVEVLTGERVTRIEHGNGRPGCTVVTATKSIAADMVLVATGVAPNVGLAHEAGLEIGTRGGIAVNEYLETSDPKIYAGGDCVESHHRVSGATVYVPLGSTANKHGRVIGDNVTGGRESFPGIVGTAILKSMGLTIGKTGLTISEAKGAGFDAIATLTPSIDRAHYYPGGKPFLVQLIADRKTERVLGAQIVGTGDVAKRIDVLAAVLTWGGTLKDVGDLDLAYAPPYSTAVDPVAHAANQTRNQLSGLAEAVSDAEFVHVLTSDADFVLLDVRQPTEIANGGIDDKRVKQIPLGELRTRRAEIPFESEIVTICQSGLRGYEACRILKDMGFRRVRFLEGGVKAWSAMS